jgi:RNA polymerase sigma factor (sigma-70 family)
VISSPADAELPWLLGVARRVLANQRRARARADRLIVRLANDRRDASESEPTRRVLEAVARLRPLDREVLLLTAWDALSHRQVASMFGCSENAVAIRAHRARARLAEELSEELSASGGREE